MKRTWTLEQIALLRDKYPDSTPGELAVLFPDKTITAIKTKATVLGLLKTIQKFQFTQEQLAYLRKHYARTQNKVLADKFGCSIHTIENKSFELGLKKDKDFVREMSRENMKRITHLGMVHRYQKGQSPVNKGKKQKEYMSPEAIERTKATRFQKGSIPPNAVPIGYERIDKDGYVYIKVEGYRKLILKHRYIWELHNGPVPEGCNIQFKDGDKHNCSIDNLYMISRSEQMKTENSMYARYPKEVQQLIQLKGALNRQISNAIKKNENGTD